MNYDSNTPSGKYIQTDYGGQSKAVCMCATLYKGGGNNSVTYIMEFYENR